MGTLKSEPRLEAAGWGSMSTGLGSHLLPDQAHACQKTEPRHSAAKAAGQAALLHLYRRCLIWPLEGLCLASPTSGTGPISEHVRRFPRRSPGRGGSAPAHCCRTAQGPAPCCSSDRLPPAAAAVPALPALMLILCWSGLAWHGAVWPVFALLYKVRCASLCFMCREGGRHFFRG